MRSEKGESSEGTGGRFPMVHLRLHSSVRYDDYTSLHTMLKYVPYENVTILEEAERFQDAGRLGNPRKDDQECIYTAIVLEVQGHQDDATKVPAEDTCGLPCTHGGLGVETAHRSWEECRLKCRKEVSGSIICMKN